MLELHGVSKRYGTVPALAITDLVVPTGRTTVLLGPSGCGKSTLLRLMLRLASPDTGEVRFAGAPVTAENVLEVRRRMGYVIQDGGLFPHLTARGNVTLLARFIGWSGPRIERRLVELAELARLPLESMDRYPCQLSGGQKQRVALMRALMLDPDVLLLDEPLGALDPIIRGELQEDLRSVFRDLGKTVVLVTHDLAEAAFLGDAIVLLRDGRIMQQGSFDELVARPASEFVTRFVQAQRGPLAGMREGRP